MAVRASATFAAQQRQVDRARHIPRVHRPRFRPAALHKHWLHLRDCVRYRAVGPQLLEFDQPIDIGGFGLVDRIALKVGTAERDLESLDPRIVGVLLAVGVGVDEEATDEIHRLNVEDYDVDRIRVRERAAPARVPLVVHGRRQRLISAHAGIVIQPATERGVDVADAPLDAE